MDAVILFATLFLGLVDGQREITLDVAPEVAAVELLLNGQVVARIDAAPWTTKIDFGEGFLPSVLDARALGENGHVLGIARQWINLPPPPAEIQVMLETNEQGGRRARASWLSTSGTEPVRVQVFLDGVPLDAPDLRDIPLPTSDGRSVRVLRIDLEFPGDLSVSREVLFGGTFVDSIDTKLSAIAVEAADSPTLERAPTLSASGEPLGVVATENGPIDLFVVRDERAMEQLSRLAEIEKRRLERNRALTNVDVYGQLARLVPLDPRASLRFIWPYRADGDVDDFRLFPRSQEWTAGDGGLFSAATLLSMPDALAGAGRPLELAEAVTVAGMAATRRNRRRAVLLLLSREGLEERSSAIRHARDYLRAVGVPLVVWTPERGSHTDASVSMVMDSWGNAIDVSSTSRFRQAGRSLWELLDRQRIVWFEGRVLPQLIESTAPGVRIAGREDR